MTEKDLFFKKVKSLLWGKDNSHQTIANTLQVSDKTFELNDFSTTELLAIFKKIKNIPGVADEMLSEVLSYSEREEMPGLYIKDNFINFIPYIRKAYDQDPIKTTQALDNDLLLREINFFEKKKKSAIYYGDYEKNKDRIIVGESVVEFLDLHSLTVENLINMLGGRVLFEKMVGLKIEVSINEGNGIILNAVIGSSDLIYKLKRKIDVYNKKIEYAGISMNEDIKNKGIGLEMMYNQIQAGNKLGYDITFYGAIGNTPGSNANGYYSWARYGFSLNEKYILRFKKLCSESGDDEIKKCSSLIDLMSFQKGRDYWKENGFNYSASFDTSENSDSYKYFMKYYNEKKSL